MTYDTQNEAVSDAFSLWGNALVGQARGGAWVDIQEAVYMTPTHSL